MKINLLKEKFFIGKKGFILNKSFFNEEELENIRNELNVTPFTAMDYGTVEKPFKVYRENSTHLYIPKIFGIEKFGNPSNKSTLLIFSLLFLLFKIFIIYMHK